MYTLHCYNNNWLRNNRNYFRVTRLFNISLISSLYNKRYSFRVPPTSNFSSKMFWFRNHHFNVFVGRPIHVAFDLFNPRLWPPRNCRPLPDSPPERSSVSRPIYSKPAHCRLGRHSSAECRRRLRGSAEPWMEAGRVSGVEGNASRGGEEGSTTVEIGVDSWQDRHREDFE